MTEEDRIRQFKDLMAYGYCFTRIKSQGIEEYVSVNDVVVYED